MIKLNSNKGIASALNEGCKELEKQGKKYGLLLDQDSIISEKMIETLYLLIKKDNKIAISSPLIVSSVLQNYDRSRYVMPTTSLFFKREWIKKNEIKEVAFNITSGSLISLKIWKEVGGFLEKLFIEGVDDEYALKVREKGNRILVNGETYLLQEYGNSEKQNKYGRKWLVTNHSKLRYYYLGRNKMYICKKYFKKNKSYVLFQILSITKMILILFFIEKNGREKIHYLFRGIIDYFHGKFGEYDCK